MPHDPVAHPGRGFGRHLKKQGGLDHTQLFLPTPDHWKQVGPEGYLLRLLPQSGG